MTNLAMTYRDTVAASLRVARQAAFAMTVGAAGLLGVAGIASVMQPDYSTSLSAVATDPQSLRKSLRPAKSTPSQASPAAPESAPNISGWALPRPPSSAEEPPAAAAIQRPPADPPPIEQKPETVGDLADLYADASTTMAGAGRVMGMLMIFMAIVMGIVRQSIASVIVGLGLGIAMINLPAVLAALNAQ